MTAAVDVACIGPAFLDLTFEGLDELPGPGQERHARELYATPGGAAITALGLARLGLRAALLAPLGHDVAGRTVRAMIEREGVLCAGPESERTPVTVVLPLGEERAMVTYEPPAPADPEALERLRPRAVVADLDRLRDVSADMRVYAVVADREAALFAKALPRWIGRARALLANRDEAATLSGERTPEAAALALAERVPTAVVTCGADGAVGAAGGALHTVPAPPVEARDTTGAGDLFTAAYVWADLQGLAVGERLRRAVVYATLSVRTATGAGSAATLRELERALAELSPATVTPASAKEAS
jgi:sugar/nucleoside kinase (ribokinase family)